MIGKKQLHIVASLIFISFITFAAADGVIADYLRSPLPKKKLILTGWEYCGLTPKDMKDVVASVGGKGVDGVGIGFKVPTDQKDHYCEFGTVLNGITWKKEWFADDIRSMNAAKSDLMPENFLTVWISPTGKVNREQIRVPWNDDALWKSVANNFGVLAYAAKKGGFRGLIFDPEDYVLAHQYELQPSDGDYESAYRLARLRGKQVMTSVAREYPDITILCYWLLTLKWDDYGTADTRATAKAAGDLWVPFVNGMLDALPPSAKLIDADEHAYGFHGPDFARRANVIRNSCLSLVEPENRAKYRTQVQVGFGLYADLYTETGAKPPLNGSKAKRLTNDLYEAFVAAEEYVWLYGEHGCYKFWNPQATKDMKLWEELIPGFERALQISKVVSNETDEAGRCALNDLQAGGEEKNLILNPRFEALADDAGPQPAGWNELDWKRAQIKNWAMWQEEPGKGVLSYDIAGGISGGAASATGPTYGCFLQSLSVNPGEIYALEASSRMHGNGRAYLAIRWMDQDGKWTLGIENRCVYPRENPGGWDNALGIVSVPDGAAKMVVLIFANLPSAEDQCWFDNVEVYKVR